MATKKRFESEVVRLAELAVVGDLLDDMHFEDCLLLGPAVIALLENNVIDGSDFGDDLKAIFWLVEEGRERVVGAIGFNRSTFRGCRFQGVGFAGPEMIREMMREAMPHD